MNINPTGNLPLAGKRITRDLIPNSPATIVGSNAASLSSKAVATVLSLSCLIPECKEC